MIDRDLAAVARELGLAVDAEAWARLDALVELWLRYAPAINLTGARTREQLLPHVGDGLATVAVAERARPLDASTRWLDVGSGAGFPALVVAALRPVELVMVEPRQRRAAFLTLAARVGACGKAEVRRERIEISTWREKRVDGRIQPEFGDFDVLSARAVWAPAEWLSLGKKGGRAGAVLLLHGITSEIPEGLTRLAEVEGPGGWVSAFRIGP